MRPACAPLECRVRNPREASTGRARAGTGDRAAVAMRLDEFCSRVEHLRLDRSSGLVKPYKPLLVAAVVILIHKGKQQNRNVFLDGGLRSAFQQLLDLLFPRGSGGRR